MQTTALEELLEAARIREGLTQEERDARTKKILDQWEVRRRERETCSECGVDTGRYSHSFGCRWRGAF